MPQPPAASPAAPPPGDAELRDILSSTRVIAVVGISNRPDRPSHQVARFLQSRGYRIVPVNPGLAGQELLGERVWPGLSAVPPGLAVDMVDIFRQPDHVPQVLDEALAHLPGLRTIWMQIGVIHEAAAAQARAAGLRVVMDRCPKIEHPRLMGPRAAG